MIGKVHELHKSLNSCNAGIYSRLSKLKAFRKMKKRNGKSFLGINYKRNWIEYIYTIVFLWKYTSEEPYKYIQWWNQERTTNQTFHFCDEEERQGQWQFQVLW